MYVSKYLCERNLIFAVLEFSRDHTYRGRVVKKCKDQNVQAKALSHFHLKIQFGGKNKNPNQQIISLKPAPVFSLVWLLNSIGIFPLHSDHM